MSDWRDMFVGRDCELSQLKIAWHKAKAREPQVVSFVAESGLGKTRLVQEFFAWLSTCEDGTDGDGYWPDELARIHNRRARRELLTLNPDPADCAKDGRAIPFFWWGIQLPDCQDDPNRVVTKLSEYEYRLKLHLLAYLNAVRIEELKREQAKKGGETALDLGLNVAGEVLPQVILSAIPGGSLAFTLLSSLIDMGKWGHETTRRQQDINAMATPVAPDQALAEKRHDITETILANLNVVCNAPPSPLEPVPLVLVIDDAQWISADLSLCKLLSDLLAHAAKDRWPLLLIVTSWETEWRAENPIDWGTGRRESIRSIFATERVELQELRLEPIAEFGTIVSSAFPGLPPDQHAMIVEKAEGNALCLYDILHHLGERPALFQQRDRLKALTPKGAEEIRAAAFEDIVWARLNSAPEHVQAAIGLASIQGIQFSGRIVRSAADELAFKKAEEGLIEGENPYAFVTKQSEDTTEFRARYYQRIAKENLANHIDPEAAERAIANALAALGEGSEQADSADGEQLWTAQLALFDTNDPAKGAIAYTALYNLCARAYEQKDYLAALTYAQQWARNWLAGKSGSSNMTAMVWIETILRELGDHNLALDFSHELVRLARHNLTAAQDAPADFVLDQLEPELCQSLERVASNLWLQGKYQEAYAPYWEAYSIRAKRYAETKEPSRLFHLATSAAQLAMVTAEASGKQSALPFYKRAADYAHELAEQQPGRNAAFLLADLLVSHGRAVQEVGPLSEALLLYTKAFDTLAALNIAEDDRAGLEKLAYASECLSRAHFDNQQYDLAEESARASLEHVRRLEAIWPLSWHRSRIRGLLLRIFDCTRKTGKSDEAVAAFNEGLQLSVAEYEASEDVEALRDTTLFAERAYDLERHASPETAVDRLVDLLEAKLELTRLDPSFHSFADLGYILVKRGDGLIDVGRSNEIGTVIPELASVIAELRDRSANAHDELRLTHCLFGLGEMHRKTGDHEQARPWLNEALGRALAANGKLSSSHSARLVSLVLEALADLEETVGKREVAAALLLTCMDLKEQIDRGARTFETVDDIAIIARKLAELFGSLGDHAKAIAYFETALRARKAQTGFGNVPQAFFDSLEGKRAEAQALAQSSGSRSVEIVPWAPSPGSQSDQVSVPASRNAECPCGSGKRYKHCHGGEP